MESLGSLCKDVIMDSTTLIRATRLRRQRKVQARTIHSSLHQRDMLQLLLHQRPNLHRHVLPPLPAPLLRRHLCLRQQHHALCKLLRPELVVTREVPEEGRRDTDARSCGGRRVRSAGGDGGESGGVADDFVVACERASAGKWGSEVGDGPARIRPPVRCSSCFPA